VYNICRLEGLVISKGKVFLNKPNFLPGKTQKLFIERIHKKFAEVVSNEVPVFYYYPLSYNPIERSFLITIADVQELIITQFYDRFPDPRENIIWFELDEDGIDQLHDLENDQMLELRKKQEQAKQSKELSLQNYIMELFVEETLNIQKLKNLKLYKESPGQKRDNLVNLFCSNLVDRAQEKRGDHSQRDDQSPLKKDRVGVSKEYKRLPTNEMLEWKQNNLEIMKTQLAGLKYIGKLPEMLETESKAVKNRLTQKSQGKTSKSKKSISKELRFRIRRSVDHTPKIKEKKRTRHSVFVGKIREIQG